MNVVSAGKPDDIVALQRELRMCVNIVLHRFGTDYQADSPSEMIKKLCAEHAEWGRQLGKLRGFLDCP